MIVSCANFPLANDTENIESQELNTCNPVFTISADIIGSQGLNTCNPVFIILADNRCGSSSVSLKFSLPESENMISNVKEKTYMVDPDKEIWTF